MPRPSLVAACFFAAVVTNVVAQEDFSILTQRTSEPGDAGELFVFVGEQVSYVSLDYSCDGCWVFDDWHVARYRVAEWIHGAPQGSELEFHVAEHSVIVPFGHSRYSLVFIERKDEALALVKYQQVPVYATAEGGFASCGPLGGSPANSERPLDRAGSELRDVEFLPRLVVDNARRLSAFGRDSAYDLRWHEIEGDEVLCRRGVPVAELVPAVVRRHDMLKAALPELAEAAR